MAHPRMFDDEERRSWVLNDEGLYQWWVDSPHPSDDDDEDGEGLDAFIAENGAEIDAAIARALDREPGR